MTHEEQMIQAHGVDSERCKVCLQVGELIEGLCPECEKEAKAEEAAGACEGGICDEGKWCDKHWIEAVKEHSWLAHVTLGAVTGVLSEKDKEDLRLAGRGHLVP